MLQVRRNQERGHFDHGWLNTYHTFSFSEYYDPAWTQFRSLRVMNEDVVQPGRGFGMHSHRDMEIITHVLSGQLEHRDSLGNGGVLTHGELQHMSAGTGIRHSEFNPSTTEPVHLYQIWVLPRQTGLPPRYQQTRFDQEQWEGRFRVVASPDGREGSLAIEQDTLLYLAALKEGNTIGQSLAADRFGWLQVLRGEVELNGTSLRAGDGAALSNEHEMQLTATGAAEVLFFDLA
jgi:redox-sensitive bicupin YhaK (pirin superfamily)